MKVIVWEDEYFIDPINFISARDLRSLFASQRMRNVKKTAVKIPHCASRDKFHQVGLKYEQNIRKLAKVEGWGEMVIFHVN